MATLNSIQCGATIFNTGVPTCAFDLDVITGLIFIPRGRTFTAAEIADWKNTLITGANADNKSERLYPVGTFLALTDNSEDTVFETLGYGGEFFVRDGQYRWMFRFLNGSKCLHTALRSFSQQEDKFDVLLIDKKNAVVGTVVTNTTTEAEELAGLTLAQIFVPKMQLADGSTRAQYWLGIRLADDTELNDRPGIVLEQDAPFPVLKSVKGMIDVSLKNITPPGAAAGTKRVAPLAGCGAQNLVDLYATELASVALWVATNSATGATIPITGVSALDGIGFEIVFNTGSPDYPTDPNKIVLTLVSPSDLADADVESPEGNRYEANTIRIPVNAPTT